MVLRHRRHWIFDLDGTLTVAQHDFDGIRTALGLPEGEPILEAIARLDSARRAATTARLDAIEFDLARVAAPQPGVARLLETLRVHGHGVAVLTRNSEANAAETLRSAGLDRLVDASFVIGRESAPPKPDAAGVRLLLTRLGGTPDAAVVVGDYRYDLEAGRAAGTATVLFDPSGAFRWPDLADACVRSFDELLAMLVRVGRDPAA